MGCYGGVSPRHKTTSFLINDSVLLDAGTVSEALEQDQIRKIRTILVSHAHMDHIRDLPTLVDNLFLLDCRHILLAAVNPVLETMLAHLFNNKLYPDFTRIPSADDPVIVPLPLQIEETVVLDELEIMPVAVNHTVACSAFIVKQKGEGFMFTADSGQTQRCWELAVQDEGVKFVLADVSFPSRMENEAKMSGHMTPRMLHESLRSYDLKGKAVYVTHMKPFFCEEIVRELNSIGEKNVRFLDQGDAIAL